MPEFPTAALASVDWQCEDRFMIIETNSAKETFQLGKQIGEKALPGQIYTLNGDLGVGKTVFTQGVACGL